jgi:hypothetical protein
MANGSQLTPDEFMATQGSTLTPDEFMKQVNQTAPAPTPIHAAAQQEPSAFDRYTGGDAASNDTFKRELRAAGSALNPFNWASQIHDAFTSPPTPEEKQSHPGAETGASLGVERLTTEPIKTAYDYWKDFTNADKPTFIPAVDRHTRKPVLLPGPADTSRRDQMESDILSLAPEGIGGGAAAAVTPKIFSKAVGGVRAGYEAAMRTPQASVIPEAASLHPAAIDGVEHIFRAAAPVGSDPGFRANLYAAAGDLNEIGQKLNLNDAKGGMIRPDMRVRATVQGINDHLAEMYNGERAPQIARNAAVPVSMQVGTDAANGLNFLSKTAGTAADRALAAKAQNGVLSLAETDQLARTVNSALRDFESMTPSDRAASAATQRRLASLKALDQELGNKISDTLSQRGEGGIREYERRYAALSSVRDQLQARMNMAELQRRVPYVQKAMHAWDIIRGNVSGLAGASQSAVANVNIGDALQNGFEKLAQSGVSPTRAVGTGAQPIAGLLTSGGPSVQRVGPGGPTAIPLRPNVEPIGQPSGPSPILPYQPSLQTPSQFVRPSEIKPAAPEPQLLNPERPENFPKGKIPKQGKLFQKTVSRESSK